MIPDLCVCDSHWEKWSGCKTQLLWLPKWTNLQEYMQDFEDGGMAFPRAPGLENFLWHGVFLRLEGNFTGDSSATSQTE